MVHRTEETVSARGAFRIGLCARNAGRKSPDTLEMKKKRTAANAEVGTARRKRRFEKQFAAGKDEEIASHSVFLRAWMACESVQVVTMR